MHFEEFLKHRAQVYGLRIVAVDKDDYVDLQVLVVPANHRSQGLGTKFMTDACDEADRQRAVIGTCPEGQTAEDTARLVRWYKCFGFVESPDEDMYPVTYVRMPRALIK